MIVFFGGLDDYTNQTHLCWRNLHLILMLVNKYRCLGSSGWALGLILKKSSTLQIPKFQVIIWFFWCQASDYVYIVQAVKPCTVFVYSRDTSSKLFEPHIFFSGRFQGKIGPNQKILFLLVFKRPGCWLKSFLDVLGSFSWMFLASTGTAGRSKESQHRPGREGLNCHWQIDSWDISEWQTATDVGFFTLFATPTWYQI